MDNFSARRTYVDVSVFGPRLAPVNVRIIKISYRPSSTSNVPHREHLPPVFTRQICLSDKLKKIKEIFDPRRSATGFSAGRKTAKFLGKLNYRFIRSLIQYQCICTYLHVESPILTDKFATFDELSSDSCSCFFFSFLENLKRKKRNHEFKRLFENARPNIPAVLVQRRSFEQENYITQCSRRDCRV